MRIATRRSLAAAREEPRADMTPMIDVVFQLLIFFLCTLHYRTLEGRLSAFLPRDAGESSDFAPSRPPLELSVRVLAPGERRDPVATERPWSGRGRYELVGRRIAYRAGPRNVPDRSALAAILRELRENLPQDQRVTLHAGPGVLQGDVLSLLDETLTAGFHDVSFSGSR